MKKLLNKYNSFVMIIIPILFVGRYFYYQIEFYDRLDFWMDRYRGRLKEDGLDSLQINSIVDASKQAGELAFDYTQDIYFLPFLILIMFFVVSCYKVKTLEKEIENLKDKLNV